jgi:flagellar biosynthesis chaperone FliJ
MKRFQSRYDRIQQLRHQHERLAKTEVASRTAELTLAIETERLGQRALRGVQQAAAAQLSLGVTGSLLSNLLATVAREEQQLRNVSAKRQMAEKQVELAMMSYQTVRLELKTVEMLVHDEKKEHRLAELRLEEKKQEERSSNDWFRKQSLTTKMLNSPEENELSPQVRHQKEESP